MGNQCAKHLPACKCKQPAAESDADPDVDDTAADVEWHGDVDDALALDDDPDVKTFDESVKARTERLIESLAKEVTAEAGAEEAPAPAVPAPAGLTFEALKDVTTTLLELDKEVVQVILEYKEEVWADEHLLGLVSEYFERSMAVLEFCRVLDGCIRQARDNQMIIQVALNMMPVNVPVATEPGAPGAGAGAGVEEAAAALEPQAAALAAAEQAQPSEEVVRAVLRELDNFLQAPHPFSDAFSTQFRTLYAEHVQMQHKLQQKKRQLDKRLRRVRAWSKVSSIMLAATAAAVLICAVVVAAVLAPPAAAAAASAAASALQPPVALESVGRWVRSAWARYEAQLGRARGVADAAHRGAYVAVRDLDTIRALVQRMRDGMASVRRTVAFAAARGDEAAAVAVAVAEVRRKQARFVRELEELAEQVGVCERFIRRARGVVLHNLMMPPPPPQEPQQQQQQESSSKPY